MRDHHARLYIGNRALLKDAVVSYLYKSRGYHKGHPDVLYFSHVQFGVDKARHLKEQAYQKPISSEALQFIITTERMTREAQNALLKLFEDPPATAEFSLIMEKEDAIIPTLLSRLHLTELDIVESKETDSFDSFLWQSYADRLDTIGTRIKAKDTAWVSAIMRGIATWAYTHQDERAIARDILMAEQYQDFRGASMKMLLEQCALSLPQERVR